MSGEDKDTEVRYSASSVGGKRAVQDLGMAIAGQIDKDESKPVPVILLKKEHYVHKQFGKVYTPLFDIQKWIGMGGEDPVVEKEAETKVEEAPATGRRRRAQ